MRILSILSIAFIAFGCTSFDNKSINNIECKNNVPPTKTPFIVVLASSMIKKSQSAYTLGYSDFFVEQMLFDEFYLYYEENCHYESGCSSNLKYSNIKANFKDFVSSSMVSGSKYVEDPFFAMTSAYSQKIFKMNAPELFKLVDKEHQLIQ